MRTTDRRSHGNSRGDPFLVQDWRRALPAANAVALRFLHGLFDLAAKLAQVLKFLKARRHSSRPGTHAIAGTREEQSVKGQH